MNNTNTTYLVGCGGIGAWVLQALSRQATIKNLTLLDGDKIERRNLDRQLFTARHIGRYKADALNDQQPKDKKYPVITQYLDYELSQRLIAEHQDSPVTLILGVDNHPARVLALSIVNKAHPDSILVSGANGSNAAEAWVYIPAWRGHPLLDPSERFPEILTDKEDDPLHPGCASAEVLEAAPQTAAANMAAASYVIQLLNFWTLEAPALMESASTGSNGPTKKTLVESFPVRVWSSAGTIHTEKVRDLTNENR